MLRCISITVNMVGRAFSSVLAREGRFGINLERIVLSVPRLAFCTHAVLSRGNTVSASALVATALGFQETYITLYLA